MSVGRLAATSDSRLSCTSTLFDSGGRSYGSSGSSPISTIRPANPDSRTVPAAVTPASPEPTITTVSGDVIVRWASCRLLCAHRDPRLLNFASHDKVVRIRLIFKRYSLGAELRYNWGMFRRVLLCYDGSEAGRRALKRGADSPSAWVAASS